ncbi:hypothetical protein [Flavobacterium sp. CAU 1735]|uniref:hypothetical protein n=1 Tax=Flavobacterium sp. CAU 1735 TaxID=3140361 RepID=UPI00326157B5
MKKIGIYISGLGQSVHQESIEKYAMRIKNELSYNDTGIQYDIKSEKIFYTQDRESTVVSIFKSKNDSEQELVYKLYDFQYHEILTTKFKTKNLLVKNLILFGLIIKKLPQIFLRIFASGGFDRPYLTFYAFTLLLLISLAIIFLIPVSIETASQLNFSVTIPEDIRSILENVKSYINHFLPISCIFAKIKEWLVPVTTFILLVIPESKTLITSLATEFACVDKYIGNGEQSQLILGNLDLLIEYIAENEPDSKIHYHCYSFGTIIAMDLLFPIGNIPSTNVRNRSALLITIGTPHEFINAYYPRFYNNRSPIMEASLTWFNVYSVADALATNFRKDMNRGPAEFGIKDVLLLPENINYEITSDKKMNIFNFFSMNSIRMHKCYWDTSPNGQSCIRLLFQKMKQQDFI